MDSSMMDFHDHQLPCGKHTKKAIEHGPVEIVDVPSYKMVDLSSSLCDSLPEGIMDDFSGSHV